MRVVVFTVMGPAQVLGGGASSTHSSHNYGQHQQPSTVVLQIALNNKMHHQHLWAAEWKNKGLVQLAGN